jgi:hypothetical protein
VDWYKYLSRKLVVVIGCDLICSLLLWFGKLTSPDYAMIVLGTVGAYIAGNVVQKRNTENKEN